jgi:hypothetical protein
VQAVLAVVEGRIDRYRPEEPFHLARSIVQVQRQRGGRL